MDIIEKRMFLRKINRLYVVYIKVDNLKAIDKAKNKK